jgi:hypothetical protein
VGSRFVACDGPASRHEASRPIVGRTDHCAGIVEDRLVNIADYFATICTLLGIDYMKENPSPGGRPVPIVIDAERVRPKVIREIL